VALQKINLIVMEHIVKLGFPPRSFVVGVSKANSPLGNLSVIGILQIDVSSTLSESFVRHLRPSGG